MEAENSVILHNLERDMQDVHRVESQIAQISQLVSLMVEKVVEQDRITSQIYDDTKQGESFLHDGHIELNKAKEHVSYSSILLTAFLLVSSLLLLFFNAIYP